MIQTKIYDLNGFAPNVRNGMYGGNAGAKEGIDINNEPWIVKYPKNTNGMRGAVASYTTSPLSEYIGSHIYEILGIPVHKTILGIRNNKLVVACKEFCRTEGALREMRALKNVYNEELAEKLETSIHSTSDSRLIPLESMLAHLELNPILKDIAGIKERFWQQFIIDILINNNDRNNGNWGVILENGNYKLAPVFDNGAAFSNKLPDYKLEELLQNEIRLTQSIDTSRTTYSLNGKELFSRDILNINDTCFNLVAKKLIPDIQNKLPEIYYFIDGIPESYENISVCSSIRKAFYIESLQLRYEKFLQPIIEKSLKKNNDISFDIL